MTWVLVVTALINGQLYSADRVTFKTKEACMAVLKQVEAHPLFKTYNGKAVCEKESAR